MQGPVNVDENARAPKQGSAASRHDDADPTTFGETTAKPQHTPSQSHDDATRLQTLGNPAARIKRRTT